MNFFPSTTFSAFAALSLAFISAPALAEPVSEWNIRAEAIQFPIPFPAPPMPHARALTILNVAMFDAANAVDGKYNAFQSNLPRESGASKDAAAASAAHAVLMSLYPAQQQALDAALAEALAPVANGEAKTKGIALGKAAAAGILALRANDGTNAQETYRPFTNPGVYVPTTVPFYSAYASSKPWVMTSGSQFRPGPPPALTSELWTKDSNEVREIGARNSPMRTAEQTDIARFWFAAGPQTWNPLLRQIVVAKKLDVVESARLFALANMAANDGYQAIFDAKYAYAFWRPVTAIRNADQTGNAATPRDASWLPLGDTPPHPEYPCAHCIASTSVGAVIQKLIGNEGVELTATSPTAPGVTRKWTRIQDYMNEVSQARIMAGFHYRFSTKAAEEMAAKIADLTVSTKLTPNTAR